MVSGTSFISKKIKEQGFKKISPKNIPSGSGEHSSRIMDHGSRG
jgi:hypothetical protein